MYDTKNYYVQVEWDGTKSGHVVVYIPCSQKKKVYTYAIFSGFAAVRKRQQKYELVLVIILYRLLLCHKNMYWYV